MVFVEKCFKLNLELTCYFDFFCHSVFTFTSYYPGLMIGYIGGWGGGLVAIRSAHYREALDLIPAAS